MIQEIRNPDLEQLYHVGCGRSLFTRAQLDDARGGMAIACRCGANGPIVVSNLNDPDPPRFPAPGSLFVALTRGRLAPTADLPHIEYYLGFSDFTCPAKEGIKRMLRALGCVSFEECDREKCRQVPARERERQEARRR